MKHVVTTLIGVMALYAIPPSALAGTAPNDGARQETVRFGDLDLTRPAGAQELYRRITHAARDVCETFSPGGSAVGISNRVCIDRAIAQAVADIDSPLLTERYERQARRQILPLQQARLNR